MTANDILRILHHIVGNFFTGDIPVKRNGVEVEFVFEAKRDENGEYYIDLCDKTRDK